MSKRKEPISKIWQDTPDHLSHQIFSELELYATDKGYYPIQNALFRFMTQPQWNEKVRKQDEPRYPKLGQWTFDYWFDRLVEEGYIEVDQVTRSIRCTHLIIVERENSDTHSL
jgi:hypothetical protein